jgi:hypothetical protein
MITIFFCLYIYSAILPEKKEYAKLAIPLTGSKGQALRVFEKNLHTCATLRVVFFPQKP